MDERTLTVGVLQFAPQSRGWGQNVQFIHRHLRLLSNAIVVLPEFFLGSYINHPLFFLREDELKELLAPLLQLSREKSVSLVGSLPIEADGQSFNRAVLVHEGELRMVYDKVRLFGDEQMRFEWGDSESNLIAIGGLKCAIRICLDISIPLRHDESSEVLLILGPSAVSVDHLRTFHKVRAMENQAMSVFCNRSGEEPWNTTRYLGRSTIFFPDGREEELDQEDEALKTVQLRASEIHTIKAGKRRFMAAGPSARGER